MVKRRNLAMEEQHSVTPLVSRYLEAYGTNASKIDASSSPLIREPKSEALLYLKEYGIPTLQSEDYKHTDMVALLGKKWQFPFESEKRRDDEGLPYDRFDNLDALKVSMSSGSLPDKGTVQSVTRQMPNGCYVGSLCDFMLSDASEQQKKRVASVYGKHAYPDNDALVALNTLFVSDALLVFIPQGVHCERLLHLNELIDSSHMQMRNERLVIIVEKEASLELLLSVAEPNATDAETLSLSVVEVDLGPSATLSLYNCEETGLKHNRLASFFIRQRAYSQMGIHSVMLHNGATRNNIWSRFLGEHASLTLNGMAIVDEERLVDTFTRVEHTKPNCFTDERYKHVAMGHATASFTGRIFVSQGADKTEAYQQDRNLLLSPDARVYAKPHLEIYADDVKCSHGMTTGQLDEQALFYMQQRGIPLAVAEKILSMAFTEDIISRIPNETLREKLSEAVKSYYFRDE